MGTARDHVDAADVVVREVLREMVDLVRHHGGRLAPGTVIVERDHDLSIDFRGEHEPDGPIIAIPVDLLVPVGGITWAPDSLRPIEGQDDLPGPARRSLELFAELYGACGTLDRFSEGSPKLAAGSDPLLEHALAATQRAGANVAATEVVPAFIGSRVLASRDQGDRSTRRRVLMPLVDAANHDHDGSPFGVTDDELHLGLRRPLGTDECFASYGQDRDPIDLALHYGFDSMRSPVASSVPATVDLGGGRRVRILGQRPGRGQAPNVRADDDELIISHLTFRRSRPSSARAELTMAVSAWVIRSGGSGDVAEQIARRAWDGIVGVNRDALDALRRAADRRGDTVGEILGSAIDRQEATITECTG